MAPYVNYKSMSSGLNGSANDVNNKRHDKDNSAPENLAYIYITLKHRFSSDRKG